MTVPVSADTVKTNQDSDITKPDVLTDNGILTHTDTVNKVGNDAIESESAKVTDSRKFQTRWEKLWPWVSYDKSRGEWGGVSRFFFTPCLSIGLRAEAKMMRCK